MKIVKIQMSLLVCDFNIYPRGTKGGVDKVLVGTYAQGMRSGAKFPPIDVDRKTKRIVDGWHRYEAHKRVVGDTPIRCRLFDFKSEEEMFLHAFRVNFHHGKNLSQWDVKHCIALAHQMNIDLERLQEIATSYDIEELAGDVRETRQGVVIPIKSEITKFVPPGKKLTKAQEEINETKSRDSFLTTIRNTVRIIRARCFSKDDEITMSELWTLHQLLSKVFQKRGTG